MKRHFSLEETRDLRTSVTELNFDSDDLPEIRPELCAWCGAPLDDEEMCSARCIASRRVDRLDAE